MHGVAGDLFSLWRSLEAKRRAEDSVVRLERRDFEREGLDWTKVAEARRQAANDRLQRAVAQRHALYPYQPSLPGINPTLMALRSREPLGPQEAAAAGVAGVGWQRSPEPVGEQLSLDLRGAIPGSNQIAPFERAAVPAAEELPRMAGDRLMRAVLALGLGGSAGLGALAELNDRDGSQF